MKLQGTYVNNIHRDFRGVGGGSYVRGIVNVLADNNQLQLATYVNNQIVENLYIANSDLSSTGIEFNRDGAVRINDATAPNHAVNLGQVNGLVSNGNTAYNERVTQFNTTYTTSVYTFSILLANGVQKQTTLQVSSAHFVIGGAGGAGVLYLSDAIAQKISDAVTAADVSSMGYQTASQVQSEVTNQITDLGLAPNPHRYIPITANSTVIDPSQHRRIVAVFENPSVLVAVLPNNAFPGTVVTLQTTGTSVAVTMDYRRPGGSGSSLLMEPNRSLQMSFSEDESAWIIEQYNILL